MLIVKIKDLEVCLSNSNLLLEKNAIWFKLLTQKSEIDKQTTGILY